MKAKDEASKLLDQAFRAALLLTGRAEDERAQCWMESLPWNPAT